MFWVVSKPKTTVDLGRDLGLLEALESFDILPLSGPELVDSGAEFSKALSFSKLSNCDRDCCRGDAPSFCAERRVGMSLSCLLRQSLG